MMMVRRRRGAGLAICMWDRWAHHLCLSLGQPQRRRRRRRVDQPDRRSVRWLEPRVALPALDHQVEARRSEEAEAEASQAEASQAEASQAEASQAQAEEDHRRRRPACRQLPCKGGIRKPQAILAIRACYRDRRPMMVVPWAGADGE
jgi:hypothetical protein